VITDFTDEGFKYCLLSEEIDFLETGHFQPRAVPWRPADLGIPPENYFYWVGLAHKISTRYVHSIKGYSTQGHTNTQTHALTSIYILAKLFSCPFFIPFTSLHLFLYICLWRIIGLQTNIV